MAVLLSGLSPRPGNTDDYADLAAVIAAPTFASRQEARSGMEDNAVIVRMEIARLALQIAGDPKSGATKALHAQAVAKLDQGHATLERIRELDRRVPDYGGVVDKAVAASPALVRSVREQQPLPGDQEALAALLAKGVTEAIKAGVNQVELAGQWSAYRSHYAELHDVGRALLPLAKERPCLYGLGLSYDATNAGPRSRAVVAQLTRGGPAEQAGVRLGDAIVAVDGKPVVNASGINSEAMSVLEPAAAGTAVKLKLVRDGKPLDVRVERSIPLNDVPDLLTLRLYGSCDGALPADDLGLTNDSGVELTNCTLDVTLVTDDADGREQTRQHVHFVKRWPDGAQRVASYQGDRSMRIGRNESFPFIKRVLVAVYSDQFQGSVRYDYWNSADRAADLRDYCTRAIEFRAKHLPATDGLIGKGDGLFQSDAGVRIWLQSSDGNTAARLQPRSVMVEQRVGARSASVEWEGMGWQGDGLTPFQTFLSPKFNELAAPEFYVLRLRFHGTAYEHVVRFAVR